MTFNTRERKKKKDQGAVGAVPILTLQTATAWTGDHGLEAMNCGEKVFWDVVEREVGGVVCMGM